MHKVSDIFIIFQDGHGMWCAAPPGFRNMMLDPTGWGPTRLDAIDDLMDHPIFQRLARANGWERPGLRDFLEVDAPQEIEVGFMDYQATAPNPRAVSPRQTFKLVTNS
jgi:hypothetical protein